MLRPRPSASVAPSIWYAAVAAPQTNPGGNAGSDIGSRRRHMTARALGSTGLDERRCALGADRDRERATFDETAAGDRIDGAVLGAAERDLFEPRSGSRIGDCRQQESRVRVQRV